MSAAPTLTRDWREQARILIATGMSVRQAARELGLPEERVKKWATRAKVCQVTTTVTLSPMSPLVPMAADILAQTGPDTKAKLAVGLNKKAGYLSAQEPSDIDSTDLLQLTKTGAVLHGWAAPGQGGPLLNLNFYSSPDALKQIHELPDAARLCGGSDEGNKTGQDLSSTDAPTE